MTHRRTVYFIVLALLLLSACSQSVDVQQETRAAKTQSVLTQGAPGFTPEATAIPQGCTEKTGTVMRMAIDSPTLDEQFTFTIYLPPCYDAEKVGGYPVIYLFHGQNMDDETWPLLGITDAADSRIDAGAPPFIMVFPYEMHNWDDVAESKFAEAFLEDLMPYVESNYAVCTERNCRAIGGISRGGGWAMHIALTHFDEFGTIGAHSMAYFAGDLYRVQNLLQTHTVDEFPRIYIDRGEDDYMHDSIDQYEANLAAAGVAHEYHVSPGSHDQDYWRSQVGTYLDWYLAGFSGQ